MFEKDASAGPHPAGIAAEKAALKRPAARLRLRIRKAPLQRQRVLRQVKSPYRLQVEETTVYLSFTPGGPSLEERLTSYLRGLQR